VLAFGYPILCLKGPEIFVPRQKQEEQYELGQLDQQGYSSPGLDDGQEDPENEKIIDDRTFYYIMYDVEKPVAGGAIVLIQGRRAAQVHNAKYQQGKQGIANEDRYPSDPIFAEPIVFMGKRLHELILFTGRG
jgi:hypothetical protein